MEPDIKKIPLKGPFKWAGDLPAQKLGGILGRDSFRFVGGAVRDSLLRKAITDIDVATTLKPEEVIKRLRAKKYKVIPTGLSHGTVTGIIEGQTFEITTLREDVETDGRRARVAFHDDWRADSERRDFTVNALYLNLDGRLYDYFGGLKDLDKGAIKFIGNPARRIEEDGLRILRFFRFHAWYGKGAFNKGALAAIRASLPILKVVSRERFQTEILKTLKAPNPGPVFKAMEREGVLGRVFQNLKPDTKRLGKLVTLENALDLNSPLRRLGALYPGEGNKVSAVLKLSNKDRDRLKNLTVLNPFPGGNQDLRALAYRLGKDTLEDRIIFSLPDAAKAKPALAYVKSCAIPKFPISGKDLEALGMAPGVAMGKRLKGLEQKWLDSDFRLTKKDLLRL